jgi:uncharacterized damage-inducible protein DinB
VTWTAPEVERDWSSFYLADERDSLEKWLEFHRGTLRAKCAGLTGAQLRMRTVEPSTMSLLGLVRHLTDVERTWFRRRLDGEDVAPLHWSDDSPDGDFDDVDTADAEADYAAYLAELDIVRAVAARHSLDDSFFHDRDGTDINLRWVMVHMIEEYARHNGHADLLRERIDGATGE